MEYKLPRTCEKILFYIYENEGLPIYRWEPLTEKAIGVPYDDFIQACALLENIGLLKLHYLYTLLVGNKFVHIGALSDGARNHIRKVNPKLKKNELTFEEHMKELWCEEDKRYDLDVFPIYDKIARDVAKSNGDNPPQYLLMEVPRMG